MRGHVLGEEDFRHPVDARRALTLAEFHFKRSKALLEWWPDAFEAGPCTVKVRRGVLASYHVVVRRGDGVEKTEALRFVPRAIWEHAAETVIAQEKATVGGGSALEKAIATIEEQG
jgi:hypothetical protein